MTRVLVTGGAGYVGSHAAKSLALSGFEPVTFDNFSTGHRWAVKWGPLIEGDLADGNLVCETISNYGIEAAIHFAADACVGESMGSPRKYFRNNVVNTLNLLEALIDKDVRHVVFSSSCATYGIPECVPIREGQLQQPVNPYGESKRFVERALDWFGKAYGLSWMALRYFNAAGADPDGEVGEDHEPETHLIPLTIQAALGHRPHLEIYGTNHPTPDGTAIRDYVHVTDLADAHVLALKHLLGNGESAALNLGMGRGYSVWEVVAAVEKVSERRVPVREAPRRPGDPPNLVADATRAAQVLGWSPKFTSLDMIVKTAYSWLAERGRYLQAATSTPTASPDHVFK